MQNAAQQGAIQQNLAARGLGGSGQEAAMRLIAQQQGANAANQAGLGVAANAQQRALQALQQAGQLSGQMGQQELGERQSAADIMNQLQYH